MNYARLFRFLFAVSIPLLVGFVGAFFTMESVNIWYLTLEKPFFNPPNWIFGPVWTLLYIMMGVSFFLVWEKGEKFFHSRTFWIYAVQLVLNFFWSIAFFGMQNPVLALLIIIALWVMIVWNIREFYKISKIAAYLLVPYLLWVSFAMMLNASIVWLN